MNIAADNLEAASFLLWDRPEDIFYEGIFFGNG